MTVSLAGKTPATFEIKSANLPLVALLLKSPDLAALSQELAGRFGDIPDFFDNEPLVVDLTPLQAAHATAELDFLALNTLLRRYKVLPIAVRGGSAPQMLAAQTAGLTPAPDAVAPRGRSASAAESPTVRAEPESVSPDAISVHPDANAVRSDANAVRPEPVEGPAGHRQAQPERAPVTAPPVIPPSALVIDKPLRSGQQIYAKGRDLVVLSMVNPGAEVIADGHIHVYAPLRGKAIAGARGDAAARIFSLCMEAELISIAGVYRTTEVALPDNVRGKPTQVHLAGGADGKLVFTPFN